MNPVLDFISSSSIFLIPFLIGSFWSGSLIARFLRGNLVIFALFFLSASLSPFLPFTILLKALLFISLVGGVLRAFMRHEERDLFRYLRKTNLKDSVLSLFFLLLAGYAFFGLFKRLTPFPYTLNWDTFEHITLATKLLAGEVHIFPSQLTDTFTFNGYTPMFHMLLSLPKLLFGASLIGTYYYAEWWFYVLVVVVTMRFVYTFSPQRLGMVSAAIFAIFGFASTVVYLPFFFLPQTLTAMSSIALLSSKKPTTLRGTGSFLLLLLSIVLTHYVIGSVGIGLILVWSVYEYLLRSSNHLLNRFFWVIKCAAVGIVLVSLLLHVTGGFQLTGREEAQYYQFGLDQLGRFFLQWYGIMGVILLFTGMIISFLSKDKRLHGIFLLSLPLFALSFSPLSYTLKFFVLGWFFFVLMLSVAVTTVVSFISPRVRFLAMGLVLITALLVYFTNQAQYKFYLYAGGKESHFSPEEMGAAAFLKAQGPRTFVISDPATQGILEALGDSNSQGGVYMDSLSRQFLSKLKEAHPMDVPIILSSIQDFIPEEVIKTEKRYFVASGRYFQWQLFSPKQKESVFFNIWKPYTLRDEDAEKITAMKNAQMKEVYHNKQLSIFEL